MHLHRLFLITLLFIKQKIQVRRLGFGASDGTKLCRANLYCSTTQCFTFGTRLHIFRLKTVHRTVFLRRNPLRLQVPFLSWQNKKSKSEDLDLVRVTGLEPVRHVTHAPQTCLSASSSTLAFATLLYYHKALCLSTIIFAFSAGIFELTGTCG